MPWQLIKDGWGWSSPETLEPSPLNRCVAATGLRCGVDGVPCFMLFGCEDPLSADLPIYSTVIRHCASTMQALQTLLGCLAVSLGC